MSEWGLFGVEMGPGTRLAVGSGSSVIPANEDPTTALGRLMGDPPHGLGLGGLGAGGGKPVVYVHLDDGAPDATFTLSLGLAAANVAERFPSAMPDTAELRFGPIVAHRGRCTAPTAVPTATSEACTSTPDSFCEAAEIPRYHGDDDVCLHVGATQSELLFYRARDLPSVRIPLMLEREGDHYALRNRSTTPIDGPVLFIERAASGAVRYRALATNERSGRVPPEGALANVGEARALLLAHAMTLGLRASEADAFLDAWAPALFDSCHRAGAEASGTPPVAFRSSDVSLLYFAPRAVVDAMIPLRTDPPAREVNRAFFVRVIDPTRASPTATVSAGTIGIGPVGSLGTIGYGGARDLAPRLHLAIGTIVATGGLTSPQVRRVVQRNLMQWMLCYERSFARNSELAGELRVTATVTPQGSVTSASIRSGSIREQDLRSCVTAAIRRWAFPSPDPAGIARFEVPITFAPPTE